MGVINLTPDSFSDGGDLNSSKKVLDQVNNFLLNGVDVIDLGAQSTRPSALSTKINNIHTIEQKIINLIQNFF